MRHEMIKVNGIRLRIARDGQGPLMVFLHGFPQTSYCWRGQLKEFSGDHEVIAPDLRGYGGSDKPKPRSAYRMQEMVADVRDLIRALGREKCVLVGHDWGAAVAWAFADAHPEMLEKLIIINVPHPALFRKGIWKPAQLRRSWYIFFFQLPCLPEWFLSKNSFWRFKWMLKSSAFRKGTFGSAEIEEYREAAAQPGALTAMLNYYRNAFTDSTRRRRSRKIQVPTLMIWGEEDVALGKELTYGTERYVEDLKIHYIPGCGHWVPEEQPEKVNQLIRGFL